MPVGGISYSRVYSTCRNTQEIISFYKTDSDLTRIVSF